MIIKGKTQSEVDLENKAKLENITRNERDKRIEEIVWRAERYERQVALGILPNDTRETYLEVLQYIQDLRDITSQSGFPTNVVWPNTSI
jgi:hypothetical protein